MRSANWLAVLVAPVLLTPAWALPPLRSVPPPPPVDPLIQRLGHRDFHVRQAASKAIAAIGGPALPALQKAQTVADAEVRRRIEGLIARVERDMALSPKRITLHMEKKPIRDVFSAVAKQTGFKIPVDGVPTGPQGTALHSFHFDKAPFWEAFDQICEAGGLALQQNMNDDTMRLHVQDSHAPFTSYNGAFKVVATGFNYSRNTYFGQVYRRAGFQNFRGQESLALNLLIGSEPRLPILKVGKVKLSCARDELDGNMVSNGPVHMYLWEDEDYYYGGQRRGFLHHATVRLAWTTKACKTVKAMKGVVPVTVLADQKPTLVTDRLLASKGQKLRVGPATFQIDDIQAMANKQYQIKVTYNEDSSDNSYDYSRIQSLQQRLEVQDEKGNKHPSYLRFLMFNSPSSGQFTITTQTNSNAKVGPPAKLVFQLWVQMQHDVPFEFKDLPLP
jgi:hypothetical protein